MSEDNKSQKVIDSSKVDSKVEVEQKKISRDRSKLKSFYDFKIDEKKLETIKQRTWNSQKRVFLIGIVFGFFTEYLLGNTRIYENIVRKATMRRLNAKKKQDDIKQQKYQKRVQKEKKLQQSSKAVNIV